MIPVLSTRNSTLPALTSLTALATSIVTVPVLGFGIRPRGPRTLPRRPTPRIISGVATQASKSIQPPAIFSTRSSPPTNSAPACSASLSFSPDAMRSEEHTSELQSLRHLVCRLRLEQKNGLRLAADHAH